MTLEITPIVWAMPDTSRLGYDVMHYLTEFEEIISQTNGNQTMFDPGSMLVFTGACVKNWYRVANKRRAWVRALDSEAVYALGVDAFETEVD